MVTFSDGLLDGAFTYDIDDPSGNHSTYSVNATGMFVKGLIDGKWVLKFKNQNKIEFIRTLVFDNGKLLSTKLIDTSIGRVASIDKDK